MHGYIIFFWRSSGWSSKCARPMQPLCSRRREKLDGKRDANVNRWTTTTTMTTEIQQRVLGLFSEQLSKIENKMSSNKLARLNYFQKTELVQRKREESSEIFKLQNIFQREIFIIALYLYICMLSLESQSIKEISKACNTYTIYGDMKLVSCSEWSSIVARLHLCLRHRRPVRLASLKRKYSGTGA